jgi:hypothetical protein
MVLSQAQKQDAYREAQQILRLAEKWQELMPGERKPNFQRAAQEVLKRALGHTTARNEESLNIHSGLMHEHEPREARLIERFLRSGTVHPDALHSFQHNITTKAPEGYPRPPPRMDDDPDLPDFDLYVYDAAQTIVPASHYEPGVGVYHASEHEPDSHVPMQEMPRQPAQARLPSSYQAVH